MTARELIQLLERFPPEATVRVCLQQADRVVQTHERLLLADYGGGPEIIVGFDLGHSTVYVGCGLEQFLGPLPDAKPELGEYRSEEEAARVFDFYVVHRRLHFPLHYPEFDYDNWLPPRTTSGQYHPRIAEILREKLLRD
jgi:hypothetical protein